MCKCSEENTNVVDLSSRQAKKKEKNNHRFPATCLSSSFMFQNDKKLAMD